MADKAKTETEQPPTNLRDMAKGERRRKLMKLAFKMGFLWPGIFIASEAGQLIAVAYLIGLAVKLPEPGWKIGLAGWAAVNLAKYLIRTTVTQASGKPTGAFATTANLVKSAMDEVTKDRAAKRSGGSGASAISQLDPAQMEKLAQTLSRIKAAKTETKPEPDSRNDGLGLFL